MKKVALINCLGVIATLTVEFGLIGNLPQIASHYNITIDKAGRLISVYELVAAISGPFMALLISNIDRKYIISACLFIALCASGVSATAPAFWILLVARVSVALTDSVFHSVALASVIGNKNSIEDVKLTSIVLAGFSIASVTLIPLSAYVGNTFGWQMAFVLKAVASGCTLLLVMLTFPSLPVLVKKTYKGQLQILAKPIFLWTAALCFFMVASAFCLYSYFADYLSQHKQMSGQMVSYMLMVFGVAGLIGNWLGGTLAARHLSWLCISTVVSIIIVAAGFQYSELNIYANVAVIFIWGLLFTFGPIVITMYINRAAPEAVEFGFALTASFIGLGIAAGTSLGGWIIVSRGVAVAPWSGIGFCIAALISLAVIVSLSRNKEPYRANQLL